MAGTFIDRVQVLRDNVGAGKLIGSVVVDQVYAAWQHFHDEFHHPDGGNAFYLRNPLYSGFSDWLRDFARKLLDEEGAAGHKALMDAMEELSIKVYEQAPWEFADLRASGHPSVWRDDELLHDRPPNVHRLTEEELDEKKKLSRLLDPHRYDRRM